MERISLTRLDASLAAGVTLVAILVRLLAQDGIHLYPDSYQFMLFAQGLSDSIPVSSAMGEAGGSWAIPFYKLGYPLLTWPFSALWHDPFAPGLVVSFVAGTAVVPVVYFLALAGLRSRLGAAGAAFAVTVSFSAVAWSRFAMSESLAIFWIASTLLLSVLAGQTRSRLLAILTALCASVMILMRLELVLLLPTVVLLVHWQHGATHDWGFEKRYLVVPGLIAFLVFSVASGWLAQDVAEGFSLNPGYLLSKAFSGPVVDDVGVSPAPGTGVATFLTHEPFLVLLAGLGLAIGAKRRDESLWPLWPGLILLIAVEAPRDDVRFLTTLVPLLAFAAGYGFEVLWGWIRIHLRQLRPNQALALSAAVSLGIVLLSVAQVSETESRWHPEQGYEYELARGIEKQVKVHGLRDVVICTFSPEAVHLISGLPARRLSSPHLDNCAAHPSPHEILVIVDEAVRRNFGDSFEQEIQSAGTRLFEIPVEAPYLQGASVLRNPLPATAYLLE